MWRLMCVLLLVAACSSTPRLPLPDWHAGGAPVVWTVERFNGRCASQWRAGVPVISIHEDHWSDMAPVEQWFCPRHELGHLREPDATELEADAFAADWLVRSDLLSDRWESELVDAAQNWPSSADHPGGVVRAAAIWVVIMRARAAVAVENYQGEP